MGKFECNDGKTCATLCDGIPDCPTSEDEISCNGNLIIYIILLEGPLEEKTCCIQSKHVHVLKELEHRKLG